MIHGRRVAAAFLLALLLSCGAAPAAAGQAPAGTAAPASEGPVTLHEYQARVDEALRLLSSDDPAGAGDRYGAAQAALRGAEEVTLPDGSTARLDFLLPEGMAPEDGIARLRAVARQLAASASDDTAARLAGLQSVLAGPEFRGAPWREQINRWLARLFGAAANTTLGGGAVSWLIGIAGGLLVAALLGYWLSGFFRNFVGEAELARGPGSQGVPLTAQEARERAAVLGQAGDYREAVRLLYLSLLLQLEEQGILRGDRTLTNWEIVRELKTAAPGLGDGLHPVARTFDAVWYGMQQPDAGSFAGYEQDVARAGSLIAAAERSVESNAGGTRSADESRPEGERRA